MDEQTNGQRKDYRAEAQYRAGWRRLQVNRYIKVGKEADHSAAVFGLCHPHRRLMQSKNDLEH